VLSDGNFYRVGGHSPVKANVRVIAATHQDLEKRVKEGSFREDLFHRLNVIRLRLPPLRERRDDIPMLIKHFLQQSAKQLGVDAKRISDQALARIALFDFPGNVRQLENLCHWLTVMAPAQMIDVKDLPPDVTPSLSEVAIKNIAAPASYSPARQLNDSYDSLPAPLASATHAVHAPAAFEERSVASANGVGNGHDMLHPEQHLWESGLHDEALTLLNAGRTDVWDELTRRFESKLILTALETTRGRRIEAAHKLGIGRNTITRKIQELGLE
jgi:two-component system, NtrC family, nitrogen regulation response regulator GlnG